MNKFNKNSKYTVWLYGLKPKEYMMLMTSLPKEHFDIIDVDFDKDKFKELEKMNILDKPDIIICNIDTELDYETKCIISDSDCGFARVSARPFQVSTGNTFELSEEKINIVVKQNDKYQQKETTKLELALNKLIEICQLSNIEKLQKLTTNKANEIISHMDSRRFSDSVINTKKVSKEYLFKLARTLNNFISFKDHYTAGHCERVSTYSEALGMDLGLDNEQIEDLILAANLHDIGKIALPDAVITKTSKLDDLEFNLMKKHVELGTSILPSNSFNKLKVAIRGHHEKYDGSGYPDGLKGDEIPYFAQILAIADSFDAMTSQRTYNKVKSAEEAFEDLRRHTKPKGVDDGLGVFYNPDLVEKFIKVISSSKTIMDDLNKNKLIAELKIQEQILQDKQKEEKDFEYKKGGKYYA